MSVSTSTLMLILRATNDTGPAFAGVQRGLTGLASSAGGVGVMGGAGGPLGLLAVGLGVAGAASIKLGGDFQQTMTKVQTLTNTTAAQMPALSKAVLGEAQKVPFSAQQLAQGLYTVASSGFSAAAGMKIIDSAFKEAAIGGLKDPAPVLDVLTTALTNYKAPASEAARYTAILQEAVKLGKGELGDFASSFSKVLPTAAAMHVGLDQVANSMAVLTNSGESAQKASQGLNRILSTVLKPTKGSQDAAAMLGITDLFTPEHLAKVGLPAFVTEIEKAIAPLGETGQKLLGTLFGQQNAARDMRILIQHYQELTANQQQFARETANGQIVQDAFTTSMGGFNLTLDQAKSSIGSAATALGLQLLPAATAAVGLIGADLTGAISGVGTALSLLPSLVAQVQPALAPVGVGLQAALGGIGTFLQSKVVPAVQTGLGIIIGFWKIYGTDIERVLSNLGGAILKWAGFAVGLIGQVAALVGPLAQAGWGLFELTIGTILGQTDTHTKTWQQAQTTGWQTFASGINDLTTQISIGLTNLLGGDALRDAVNGLSSVLASLTANVLWGLDDLVAKGIDALDTKINGWIASLTTISVMGHTLTSGVGNLLPTNLAAQNTAQWSALTKQLASSPDLMGKNNPLAAATGPMIEKLQENQMATRAQILGGTMRWREQFTKPASGPYRTKPVDQGGVSRMAYEVPYVQQQAQKAGGLPPVWTSTQTQQAGADALTKLLKDWQTTLSKTTVPGGGSFGLTGLGGTPPPTGGADDGSGDGGAGGLGLTPAQMKKQLLQAVKDAKALFKVDLLTPGASQGQKLGDIALIKSTMVEAMQKMGLFSAPQIAAEMAADMKRVETNTRTTATHLATISPLAGFQAAKQAGFGQSMVSFAGAQQASDREQRRQDQAQILALQQTVANLTAQLAAKDRQTDVHKEAVKHAAATAESTRSLAAAANKPGQSLSALLRPHGVALHAR